MLVMQKAVLAIALGGAVVLGSAGDCAAQSTEPAGSAQSSPSGKGIVGGALAGAETVLLLEAAFGVDPVWAYLVGGALGAGGGGLAGYYLEQGAAAEGPTFLLAGSIALIAPTMMVVMNATRYQPPESQTRDDGETVGAGLRLPAIAVRDAFTPTERHRFQLGRTTEYHLSLLRGAF